MTIKTNRSLLNELKELNDKLKIEQYKYNTSNLENQELVRTNLHIKLSSNIMIKLLLIITRKLFETLKNNKILFALVTALIVFLIKNKFINSWMNLLKFFHIQKKISI